MADAVATSYHAVVQRAQARPGMTVALAGVGGAGRHALPMARLAGARTISFTRQNSFRQDAVE